MTVARREHSSQQANCTLIARRVSGRLGRKRPRERKSFATWAFVVGAGDGNRTRAVSLGS
jgi:hypothetical protein